ncbi:GntR family transcriptional regulator [Kitasatospora sp. NPDC101183]|uniref:GntR family transcriptional regulator n=1 Tax=Kitasatospora sp. NPDC101183 TaxID=3364100 RepID=UPI0038277875
MENVEGAEKEAERIARVLRAQIAEGARPCGAALTERAVAEELGVSRMPVQEAIRRLTLEGLLAPGPRRCAVVQGLTDADLAHLDEVRRSFYGLAVRLAATRRSDADLAELAPLAGAATRALDAGDPEGARQQALAFRDVVVRAAGNPLLGQVLEILRRRGAAWRPTPAEIAIMAGSNVELLAAVEAGDAERAEAALNGMMRRRWEARRRQVLGELNRPGTAPAATTRTETVEHRVPPPRGATELAEVTELLRRQIVDGTRPAGAELRERAIAEEFGTSRMPVRQAIGVLAAEGLVSPGQARVPATVSLLEARDVALLAEVDRALVTLAVRAAAQRWTDPALGELARLVDASTAAVAAGRTAEARTHVLAFRGEVIATAGNRLLSRLDGFVRSRVERVLFHRPDFEDLVREQRALYRAIAARDPELAEEIIAHNRRLAEVA